MTRVKEKSKVPALVRLSWRLFAFSFPYSFPPVAITQMGGGNIPKSGDNSIDCPMCASLRVPLKAGRGNLLKEGEIAALRSR